MNRIAKLFSLLAVASLLFASEILAKQTSHEADLTLKTGIHIKARHEKSEARKAKATAKEETRLKGSEKKLAKKRATQEKKQRKEFEKQRKKELKFQRKSENCLI